MIPIILQARDGVHLTAEEAEHIKDTWMRAQAHGRPIVVSNAFRIIQPLEGALRALVADWEDRVESSADEVAVAALADAVADVRVLLADYDEVRHD